VVVHPELDPALRAGAGAVLQGGEARLALHALEHHATCDADLDLLGLEFLARLETVVLEQARRPMRRARIVRIRNAAFAQARQLGAALGDDLVLVDRCRGRRPGGFVAHWLRLPLSNWRR